MLELDRVHPVDHSPFAELCQEERVLALMCRRDHSVARAQTYLGKLAVSLECLGSAGVLEASTVTFQTDLSTGERTSLSSLWDSYHPIEDLRMFDRFSSSPHLLAANIVTAVRALDHLKHISLHQNIYPNTEFEPGSSSEGDNTDPKPVQIATKIHAQIHLAHFSHDHTMCETTHINIVNAVHHTFEEGALAFTFSQTGNMLVVTDKVVYGSNGVRLNPYQYYIVDPLTRAEFYTAQFLDQADSFRIGNPSHIVVSPHFWTVRNKTFEVDGHERVSDNRLRLRTKIREFRRSQTH